MYILILLHPHYPGTKHWRGLSLANQMPCSDKMMAAMEVPYLSYGIGILKMPASCFSDPVGQAYVRETGSGRLLPNATTPCARTSIRSASIKKAET